VAGSFEGPDEYLRAYLTEVESYSRLDENEERELLQVVAERALGAESAKRRVVEANLRLVVDVARRYQSTGRHLLDLIQEGNLGLVRAVETFDPGAEHGFETLARWSIREAISSAIRGRGQ
jgi:DNA-directed RNA polymerase sigma subunit (sigma70/sigma32)